MTSEKKLDAKTMSTLEQWYNENYASLYKDKVPFSTLSHSSKMMLYETVSFQVYFFNYQMNIAVKGFSKAMYELDKSMARFSKYYAKQFAWALKKLNQQNDQ